MKELVDFSLQGLDILVVDDDPAFCRLVSGLISKYDGQVQTATSGTEGVALFEQTRFPLIVTDICMPGMDGIELVRRIRQIDPATQVIGTSVNRQTDCLISAIELGFSDYLLKPVEADSLLWALKRCRDAIANRLILEDERDKFRTVIECLGEGISIKDLDYRIVYQNRAMTEMFGDKTGSACFELFGQDGPCRDCPTMLVINDGQSHSSSRSYSGNGKTIYVESTASLIRNSRGTVTGTVEIIRDVSERIHAEQSIRDLAFHDPLTNLPNRRLFEDRLEQTIAKSRRYNMKFGLMYLDLDHFKHINDTFGHESGDEVLIEAGDRIRSCCKRDLDTISRKGGDEFCIIITDCGERGQLEEIADSLLQAFSLPFVVLGSAARVTTSIGISIFPDDATEPKALEAAADKAMYAAKRSGRNTRIFFETVD